MAAMVMTPPQFCLPTSNGYAVQETEDMVTGDGLRVDIGELQQQEPFAEAYNQSTPANARGSAADLPNNMISSSKNVVLSSNGPNAPEAPSINNSESSRTELPNGNNGNQHQNEQNGAPGEHALDPACNGSSDSDSQEKLDFQPVSEPQDVAGAFPSTFGPSSSVSLTAEDQSNPPASTTATKSPSRPASPYVQGQDLNINSVQANPQPGGTEAVVSTTNLRNVSFQSSKGEFHQHQEHHSVLTSTSHPQSQFLLTISAPTPVPSQSGHYESSETGLSYQHQSSQIGEDPQQLGPKEACQLPECVTNRASAGMAAASGVAQLEHLLARVKHEKTVSRARAWEEGAKAIAYNRYTRDESKITAWENTKKAKAEARMRKAQENLDKQRAKHIEKMKNALASAHCKAQEKRAAMEARRAEDIVKAEEIASRIRASGKMPRRCLCMPV